MPTSVLDSSYEIDSTKYVVSLVETTSRGVVVIESVEAAEGAQPWVEVLDFSIMPLQRYTLTAEARSKILDSIQMNGHGADGSMSQSWRIDRSKVVSGATVEEKLAAINLSGSDTLEIRSEVETLSSARTFMRENFGISPPVYASEADSGWSLLVILGLGFILAGLLFAAGGVACLLLFGLPGLAWSLIGGGVVMLLLGIYCLPDSYFFSSEKREKIPEVPAGEGPKNFSVGVRSEFVPGLADGKVEKGANHRLVEGGGLRPAITTD